MNPVRRAIIGNTFGTLAVPRLSPDRFSPGRGFVVPEASGREPQAESAAREGSRTAPAKSPVREEPNQRSEVAMTTIRQEVIVRTSITCAAPDCGQTFAVDEIVPLNAVRECDATIGYSRQLGTARLFDESKLAGWVIGAHDNVCRVHVGAAVYAYMNALREQQREIAKLRASFA